MDLILSFSYMLPLLLLLLLPELEALVGHHIQLNCT
jgi:hypothetical protein